MKIGIIKEGKNPPDKRVALTPSQCKYLIEHFPEVEIQVQSSKNRAIPDSNYVEAGIQVLDEIPDCDHYFGVKEVPIEMLHPGKKYSFFSHTLKKQPYNRGLLKAILAKDIELIDYECMVDEDGQRIIGFGRFAGIVGAYNGILGYGLKNEMYKLKYAQNTSGKKELETELLKVKLPPVKMLITGGGRVANGAQEVLGALKIRKVTPFEIINFQYTEPVYSQLRSSDYNRHAKDHPWNTEHFYKNPKKYISKFKPFWKACDILIHCAFWDHNAPRLFELEDLKDPDFRLKMIADLSCDIKGGIPCTLRPSVIPDPFYDYDPTTGEEVASFNENLVTIMAVDNLPCSLPTDASKAFGDELIEKVIPSIIHGDPRGIIERATMTQNGKLTERYKYLKEYVSKRA
ncbi:MAG: alanine dehydrogenase [Bacteroidia bacterium]|nr:alanine dehydrogenase [Bacteroidia bacterium]